jgi:hypothetical protein
MDQICFLSTVAGGPHVFSYCLCYSAVYSLETLPVTLCDVFKGMNKPHNFFQPATQRQVNLWWLMGVKMRGREGPLPYFTLTFPKPPEMPFIPEVELWVNHYLGHRLVWHMGGVGHHRQTWTLEVSRPWSVTVHFISQPGNLIQFSPTRGELLPPIWVSWETFNQHI